MRRQSWTTAVVMVVFVILAGVAVAWLMSGAAPPAKVVPIVAEVTSTSTAPSTTTTVAPTTSTTVRKTKAAKTPPTTKKRYPQGRIALLTPETALYPADCPGLTEKQPGMSEARAHHCWDRLIAHFDWPGTTVAKVFSVMMCESAGRSAAVNHKGTDKYGTPTGLMQVKRSVIDPLRNMADANRLYKERGLQPWACA